MKTNGQLRPNHKYPPETQDGGLESAVTVLRSPGGLVAHKINCPQTSGRSGSEITRALDFASGGELLRAAGFD